MKTNVNAPRKGPRDRADAGLSSSGARAYDALREMLVKVELRPGTVLNEDELIARLEVGRTPLREAIKRLESEQLVVVYPRRGTFAADVNINDLTHISDVRGQLEPHAAALAAERAEPDDRERVERLLRTVAATGQSDLPAWMDNDLEVHRTLYQCTHNPYLEATLTQYYNLAARIWYLFIHRIKEPPERVGGDLLQAVLDGDAQRARAIMLDHVTGFEGAVRAVM